MEKRERYQSLPKAEKDKTKQQYDHERCKTLPEDEKQELTEYKSILQNEKKPVIIIIKTYFYLENLVSFLGLCEMCR